MTSADITVTNQLGMHARAAARFVHVASAFDARIQVECGSRTVDGKSILGLLLLVASRGATVTVTADGVDEVAAVAALLELVGSGFADGASSE